MSPGENKTDIGDVKSYNSTCLSLYYEYGHNGNKTWEGNQWTPQYSVRNWITVTKGGVTSLKIFNKTSHS